MDGDKVLSGWPQAAVQRQCKVLVKFVYQHVAQLG
jgi:hypothetical protein